jgi:molybdenum cofactor biosynthesis enzyme MoaA
MTRATLNGYVDCVTDTTVSGWAWDSGKPNDPVIVEISREGQPVATISADRFRQDLLEAKFGNGRHGFELTLPPQDLNVEARVFSARIQGSTFELSRSPFRCGPPRPDSGVRPGTDRQIDLLKAEIASFSQSWKPRSNLRNRLSSLSARDGGLTRIDARPQWFMIETTSHCNLKCVICPHGHDAMPNKSELDTSHFSKNLDFVALADRMQLFGTGEPLMSAAFWEILESIDPESQTEVSINSNGTLLNSERIDRLLRSPLSWISISLDAARPDTYQKVRGGNFQLVISRVRDLIRERDARPRRNRLAIYINMTLMRENIEEFPEFVDLAADLGADGVQVCQLLWHDEHRTWEVQKGDWRFVYRDQLLRTVPGKANGFIRLAIERGAARNVPVVFDWSQFEGSAPVVHGEDA